MTLTGFRGLKSYRIAYDSAMTIFELSKKFPKNEDYSLIDQIRRSSRSICSNIAEAYRKRKYPKHFISKITDADGECSETTVWLDFSRDCGYITNEEHKTLLENYESVGKLLGFMSDNPGMFDGKK